MANRGGLDIPIAIEISGSKIFIWLTVFLGAAPKSDSAKNGSFCLRTQRCSRRSSITDKDRLMLALPIDNRAMSNAVLRARIEKVIDDVVAKKDVWQ